MSILNFQFYFIYKSMKGNKNTFFKCLNQYFKFDSLFVILKTRLTAVFCLLEFSTHRTTYGWKKNNICSFLRIHTVSEITVHAFC